MFNLNEADAIKNKIVIITGSNSGIGFEVSKILSSKGAKIIVACRNEKKGRETQRQMGSDVEYVHLDLRSFESIEYFAKSIKTNHPKIDILINNAGVMFPPFTKTSEKLELTFGVNYIGHYLLTNKLMPLLRNVKGSRIINMSSIAHYRVHHINWDNINSQIHYKKTEAYQLSNLFRIMFTMELEKKFRQKRYETIAVSCHPGVTLTNIMRFMPKLFRNPIFRKLMNTLVFHSPYKAAMPVIMATTSPHVKGGEFVGLNTKKQYRGTPTVIEPNQLVFDKSLRQILWRKSVDITGVDLE